MTKKTKVLYIAGLGRSGSTILGNILGSMEGFFHIGESCYIWENGISMNRNCGCGASFKSCKVWEAIFNEAFNGFNDIQEKQIRYCQQRKLQNKQLAYQLLIPKDPQLISSTDNSQEKQYLLNIEKLYQAISSVTNCNIIVDSSKSPSYAYALSLIPSLEIYIIHLVRDSRAVAYSWQKKILGKDLGYNELQEQRKLDKICWRWNAWNIILQMIGKRFPKQYMLLRYEDFVNQPQKSVQSIVSLVQKDLKVFPFLSSHKVNIDVNHTIWGNPNRSKTGTVKLYFDDEWKRKMQFSDKALVTTLTLPLLLKYKYSNRTSLVEVDP